MAFVGEDDNKTHFLADVLELDRCAVERVEVAVVDGVFAEHEVNLTTDAITAVKLARFREFSLKLIFPGT